MKTSLLATGEWKIKAGTLALFFIAGIFASLIGATGVGAQTASYDYSGQGVPPYCDPLPEEPTALSECMAYYGTDGQAHTYTPPAGQTGATQPYDYTGTTAPAYCTPLPEDSTALSECMAYYGTTGQANIHGFGATPVTPATPVEPGPEQPWPPTSPTPVLVEESTHPLGFNDSSEFATTVSRIYMYALGLSAMLAVVMTVFGGYTVMTARGNAGQAAKGKEYILSALIGMVLLMSAYLILSTINPDLTRFDI